MSDNITDFPLANSGRETPERLLKAVLKTWEDLDDVIIIGVTREEDGDSYTIASTCDTIAETVGILEVAKFEYLN